MLRFSLELSHHAWTSGNAAERVARTIEIVRAADQAGFDSLWLTEDPDGWDPFVVLGALSRETTAIRLGPGVTNPSLRHPNLIAASAATLDHLSGGRAFIGLGRGQVEWYAHSFGMDQRDRLGALEATISLLRQWATPPHRATSSEPIVVQDWERTLVPLTAGGPPIYLAAAGPQTLALAGRLADGVRINELATSAYLAEAIGTVRASAREAGRDPARISFYAHPGITITSHVEETLERKKAFIALIHALPGMERMLATPGIDHDRVIADVRRAMRTDEVLARGGGFAEMRRVGDLEAAKRAIPLELVDAAAIVGPLPVVRRRLAELAQLGVTDCFLDLDRMDERGEALQELLARLAAAT